MRRLGVPSATAGIVAAALAACNGAVTLGVVARDSGPESDGGPELDAGVDADDDASTVADAADAGEEDGSQFPLACPACPPPSDPYWDGIFPEAGLPSDASVCGVISAGRLDSDPVARVTRELYEALVLRRGVDSFPCPRAICETNGVMAFSCFPLAGGGAGGSTDSGLCISDGGVYRVGCAQAGRRVADMTLGQPRARTLGGAYLAEQAALEAASVVAFTDLASQLERLGAPRDLVEDCLVAAREEERHASVVAALARRLGGEPCATDLGARVERDVLSLAIENAVEGVVRETFAAAVAVHQAATASTPRLRAQLAGIARDELSHAELSRRIHAWSMDRLTDEERARVRAAMTEAIAELDGSTARVGQAVSDPSLRMVGVPDPDALRVMFGELVSHVWT